MPTGVKMSFPKKDEIDEVLKELEKKEGTAALSPDATPLEKLRFGICQKFLKFKLENNLTQKELAKTLEVDEAKVSKILHHRIKEFSTDRLINLYLKIDPNMEIKVA
jgi:predicted XRE-type DNA-binding protein